MALTGLLILHPLALARAETWSTPDTKPDHYSFVIDEAQNWDSISRLMSVKPFPGSSMPHEYNCAGYGEEPCKFSSENFDMGDSMLIATKCDDELEINCIESLSFGNTNSSLVQANFLEYIDGPKVQADPARGLTEGGTISLWEAPNAPHAGGSLYAVKLGFSVTWDRVKNKFIIIRLDASVAPFSLKEGSNYRTIAVSADEENGRARIGIANRVPSCIWNDAGRCGVLEDFPKDVKVELTFRAVNTIGGWFKGRLQEPSIDIGSIPGGANKITITAQPITVPRFASSFAPDAADEGIKRFLSASPWIKTGTLGHTRSEFDLAFDWLETFRSVAKDTAAGSNTVWNFGSTVGSNLGSKCLVGNSKLLGLVTTNATVFMGGPPKFSGGFLNYRVAGMHHLADGSISKGSYDLIIRSDTARCLYGYGSAPVSAIVSISGQDQSVATTVVSEANGWLKLSAKNFTFSEKTIKIKLQQKKQTIVCVSTKNSKLNKKVTSNNPKCPAGYKKQ